MASKTPKSPPKEVNPLAELRKKRPPDTTRTADYRRGDTKSKAFDLSDEERARIREERRRITNTRPKVKRVRGKYAGGAIPPKRDPKAPRKKGNANSKGRPFKKGVDERRNTDGAAPPRMSLTWFRDFMQQPLEQMLAKPRIQMSAIEATVVEAVRMSVDRSGETAIVEAIESMEERGGEESDALPRSVKRGVQRLLGGDGSAAKFFVTPDDRLKAIKHIHAYSLGAAPTMATVDLKNNGGSFEGNDPPPPTGIEVVLVAPDGTRSHLPNLSDLPPHPDADKIREEDDALSDIEGRDDSTD